MAAIEIKNLWKEYGQDVVLERLNAKVEEGEFVTVVGASGCGKTTFLKMMLGTESPTRGQLLLDGKPIPDEPDETRGIVFQRYSVLPHLTAVENVMLAGELESSRWLGRVFGGKRRALREQAEEMLASVGLDQALGKYPHELSGGMQQRASIARALAFDADILLMDEPFGALDEIVRDHLNEQLLKLWARTNKTIGFVTHSIPEAVYLSTKIVVMSPRPGRITDVIESTLPKERPLDIRDTPEFLEIAHRVRDGLRAGHAYD